MKREYKSFNTMSIAKHKTCFWRLSRFYPKWLFWPWNLRTIWNSYPQQRQVPVLFVVKRRKKQKHAIHFSGYIVLHSIFNKDGSCSPPTFSYNRPVCQSYFSVPLKLFVEKIQNEKKFIYSANQIDASTIVVMRQSNDEYQWWTMSNQKFGCSSRAN